MPGGEGITPKHASPGPEDVRRAESPHPHLPAEAVARQEFHLTSSGEDSVEKAGELADEVIVLPQRQGEALVVGGIEQAARLGDVIGIAGQRLVDEGRYASAAFNAGVEAAQSTGYLVALHPESARALRELERIPVKDAPGYVWGAVKDSNGRFKEVIKLRDVSKLSTLSSGAAILSSLAMQAQLDRIERTLGQIRNDVAGVQGSLDRERDADYQSARAIVEEIYRVATLTGQLTQAQWDQLAPMAHAIYRADERSGGELRLEVDKVRTLSKSAKGRRVEVRDLTRTALPAVDRALGTSQTLTQFQLLRLWHMSITDDPALEEQLRETRRQVAGRRDNLIRDFETLDEVLDDVDVKGRIQRLHVIHRKRIRADHASIKKQIAGIGEYFVAELPALPAAGDESVIHLDMAPADSVAAGAVQEDNSAAANPITWPALEDLAESPDRYAYSNIEHRSSLGKRAAARLRTFARREKSPPA